MKNNCSTDRRTFLRQATLAGLAAATVSPSLSGLAGEGPPLKMKICLSPGSIGVKAGQEETIRLAHQYGYTAVGAYGDHLASLSPERMNDLLASLKEYDMTWGPAGLPVQFRGDDARFRDGLRNLPKIAAGLERAGVTRVGTWLMPGHASLTYLENFRLHARRLREIAAVLKDHGQRLGLEYVGTFTLRASRKFPFVHCMKETRELISAIGTGNVGVVPDSWHWWQAGDTPEDLLALTKDEVISVDINDAPRGVEKNQQIDGRRELPLATGVIDLKPFLEALRKIGYDGPVRAEPFNKTLNEMDNDAACKATVEAMKRAFALVG